jgi:hypothetical protein
MRSFKSKEVAGCCVVSACRRAKLMIITEADPGPKLHNEARPQSRAHLRHRGGEFGAEATADAHEERAITAAGEGILVEFGSQGLLGMENKTDRQTALSEQQLHRYSQVLAGGRISILALLCVRMSRF